MKRRHIAIAMAAAALAVTLAGAPAYADPTWPPRPVHCPKQHVCVTWAYPQANGTACFMTRFTARNHTGKACK